MPRKNRKLEPGRKAPDFELEEAASGRRVALKDLLGRPSLIVFLRGTW